MASLTEDRWPERTGLYPLRSPRDERRRSLAERFRAFPEANLTTRIGAAALAGRTPAVAPDRARRG